MTYEQTGLDRKFIHDYLPDSDVGSHLLPIIWSRSHESGQSITCRTHASSTYLVEGNKKAVVSASHTRKENLARESGSQLDRAGRCCMDRPITSPPSASRETDHHAGNHASHWG